MAPGSDINKLFKDQGELAGMKFDLEIDTSSDTGMTKGLDDAAAALKSGLPVPVRVGDGGKNGHAVLLDGR